jgi:hypothetical protein
MTPPFGPHKMGAVNKRHPVLEAPYVEDIFLLQTPFLEYS